MATGAEQVGRERRRAPAAAIAAVLAALLPLAGTLIGTRAGKEPVEKGGKLLFIHEHASTLIAGAVLVCLGTLALAVPLVYLYDATKARRPELPRVALVCAVFGAIGFGLVSLAFQLTLASKASTFASHGDQTYEEAKRVFDSGILTFIRFAGLATSLALAFAFVFISLNAMRVGLLTRFMGILGIIAGVLIGLQLPGPGVVQWFWLGALAALIAGRWPRGVPPAWTSGLAEPWPSQQALREERERKLAQHRGAGGAPSEPEPATAAPAASGARGASAARKRKRKKRR